MSENARRLLALGVSIGLVLIGVMIRERGGGGDGGGGGGGGDRTLVCPPELAEACAAVDDDYTVRIEDAPTTADALTQARDAGGVDGDVWLVPRPWVEAVSVGRELGNRPAILGEPSRTVARSPVVLVVQQSRVDALASGPCTDGIAWRCVGDVADGPWTAAGGDETWGTVRAGIARPASATGLVALGAATADYVGDPGFASNDFDGGLDNWLAKLAASADAAGSPEPVAEMITRGPGHLAVLGTVEAEADAAFGRDAVRIVVPEPVVTADLVAVAITDVEGDAGDAGELAGDGDLLDALAEGGWRVGDRDLADGVARDLALPDEPGLPRGDVLRVLLDRWSQLV